VISGGLAASVFALWLLVLSWTTVAAGSQSSVDLVSSGEANVILMRHALAPGTGDPGNFTLGECDTQRNLNEVGRQQARDTGRFLKAAGITLSKVYTSQWCRCVETAELLQISGEVVELPQINSFFQAMSQADSQTQSLKLWLSEYAGDEPVLLVTHQVNITAYTGVYPQSGELVVGRFDSRGEFTLLGRVEPR
jgi:phosphohistidine phosphatase SixA